MRCPWPQPTANPFFVGSHYLENLLGMVVIDFNVHFFQEVFQLFQAHLVVFVFVSFPQTGVNPAAGGCKEIFPGQCLASTAKYLLLHIAGGKCSSTGSEPLSSCWKSAWAPWAADTSSPSAPTEHSGALAEGKRAVLQLIVTWDKILTIWPRLDKLSLPCRSFWPQPETVWFLFYDRKYILLQTVKRG